MKGKISISRFMSNIEPHRGVTITVEDANSGVRFLDVTMTIPDFGDVVTGLSDVDCEFELRGTEYVGMQEQHKEEDVPLPDTTIRLSKDEVAKIVAPFEVDGWKARQDDVTNHHRYNSKNNTARVTFFRYVK